MTPPGRPPRLGRVRASESPLSPQGARASPEAWASFPRCLVGARPPGGYRFPGAQDLPPSDPQVLPVLHRETLRVGWIECGLSPHGSITSPAHSGSQLPDVHIPAPPCTGPGRERGVDPQARAPRPSCHRQAQDLGQVTASLRAPGLPPESGTAVPPGQSEGCRGSACTRPAHSRRSLNASPSPAKVGTSVSRIRCRAHSLRSF